MSVPIEKLAKRAGITQEIIDQLTCEAGLLLTERGYETAGASMSVEPGTDALVIDIAVSKLKDAPAMNRELWTRLIKLGLPDKILDHVAVIFTSL